MEHKKWSTVFYGLLFFNLQDLCHGKPVDATLDVGPRNDDAHAHDSDSLLRNEVDAYGVYDFTDKNTSYNFPYYYDVEDEGLQTDQDPKTKRDSWTHTKSDFDRRDEENLYHNSDVEHYDDTYNDADENVKYFDYDEDYSENSTLYLGNQNHSQSSHIIEGLKDASDHEPVISMEKRNVFRDTNLGQTVATSEPSNPVSRDEDLTGQTNSWPRQTQNIDISVGRSDSPDIPNASESLVYQTANGAETQDFTTTDSNSATQNERMTHEIEDERDLDSSEDRIVNEGDNMAHLQEYEDPDYNPYTDMAHNSSDQLGGIGYEDNSDVDEMNGYVLPVDATYNRNIRMDEEILNQEEDATAANGSNSRISDMNRTNPHYSTESVRHIISQNTRQINTMSTSSDRSANVSVDENGSSSNNDEFEQTVQVTLHSNSSDIHHSTTESPDMQSVTVSSRPELGSELTEDEEAEVDEEVVPEVIEYPSQNDIIHTTLTYSGNSDNVGTTGVFDVDHGISDHIDHPTDVDYSTVTTRTLNDEESMTTNSISLQSDASTTSVHHTATTIPHLSSSLSSLTSLLSSTTTTATTSATSPTMTTSSSQTPDITGSPSTSKIYPVLTRSVSDNPSFSHVSSESQSIASVTSPNLPTMVSVTDIPTTKTQQPETTTREVPFSSTGHTTRAEFSSHNAQTVDTTLPSSTSISSKLPTERFTTLHDETITQNQIAERTGTNPLTTRSVDENRIRVPVDPRLSTKRNSGHSDDSSLPDSTAVNRAEIRTSPDGLLSPTSFFELKLRMSWVDFCTNQMVIRNELLTIIRHHAEQRNVTGDQLRVMNSPSKCIIPSRMDAEISVNVYMTNRSHFFDRILTSKCAHILMTRLPFREDSIIRNKLIEVHFHDVEMPEASTSTQTASSVSVAHGRVREALDDAGVRTATILGVVTGCCTVAILMLLFVFRQKLRLTFISYLNQSLSVTTSVEDSIQMSTVVKSLSDSGLVNFGLDLIDPPDPTHPCNLLQLAKMCTDQETVYSEFQKIPTRLPRLSVVPDGDEDKNRYANVLPLRQTMVELTSEGQEPRSSYINANFITGPEDAPEYYIATQAPTDVTVPDFWTMVWQQGVKVIIMLTQMEEDGQSRCAAYWPELTGKSAAQKFGDFLVELKHKEVQAEYIVSKLELNHLRQIETREIVHYWSTCWPAKGLPEPISLVKLVLDTRSAFENGGVPVLVHCSPGTGRTCSLIALDLCMRQMEKRAIVDVMRTVHVLRQERAGAIQNKEQYVFIYQALNEYASMLMSPAVSAASSATTLHALLPS